MKLAVIIPYYNGAKFIARCLNSFESMSLSNVFIVDNSEEPLKVASDAQVIRSPKKKIGFGAAVNLGLEIIFERDYDYVLILNQDAYFKKGHFTKLLNYLADNELDRFASPMIYQENLKTEMPFIMERYFPEGAPLSVVDIEDFVAVALIAPVSLMKSLKGFDTGFFMYYEDNDLIARSNIEKAVRILPFVHVEHHNPDLLENRSSSIEKLRWQRRSALRYEWKHGDRLNWLIGWLKHLLKSILGR